MISNMLLTDTLARACRLWQPHHRTREPLRRPQSKIESWVEVVRLVGVLTKGPFYRFYRWWKLRDVQAVGPGGPGTVATKSSRTEAVMSRCIRPANIRPDRW